VSLPQTKIEDLKNTTKELENGQNKIIVFVQVKYVQKINLI